MERTIEQLTPADLNLLCGWAEKHPDAARALITPANKWTLTAGGPTAGQPIDWDKPVRTVGDHRPVRVLCTDLDKSAFPVAVAIRVSEINSWVGEFSHSGDMSPRTRVEFEREVRLENVPVEMETKGGWVNIYCTSTTCYTAGQGIYTSMNRAKQAANGAGNHVATVYVTWEEPRK